MPPSQPGTSAINGKQFDPKNKLFKKRILKDEKKKKNIKPTRGVKEQDYV